MTIDTNKTLSLGIAALKAGRRAEAKKLLEQATKLDKQNETAWLWLSGAVDTDEERLACLQQVLAINPSNKAAQQGLSHLVSKSSSVTQESYLGAEDKHAPAHNTAFKKCPYCAEEIRSEAIVCRFCGRDLQTGQIASISTSTPSQLQPSSYEQFDKEVERLAKQGWHIINKTNTSAQLKKPKEWNKLGLIFLVVFPLLTAIIIDPLCLGSALAWFLVIVVDYLLQKDSVLYITAEQVSRGEAPATPVTPRVISRWKGPLIVGAILVISLLLCTIAFSAYLSSFVN